MVSAEREPKWGSGGVAPSGVQGQSPWSGGVGGEAPQKPKSFFIRNMIFHRFMDILCEKL